MKISPLAPKNIPDLPPLQGVKLATMEAGIKYKGRKDLLLMQFDQPAAIAGVFTQSKCPGAPVVWCKKVLASADPKVRAIVINSGNANAFTGAKGDEAAALTAKAAAAAVGCTEEQVYLASTGVIGEPLDTSTFNSALTQLSGQTTNDHWLEAAQAIMTTDTYAKVVTVNCKIDGEVVTINGIAKGSGMIAPDMATMLSFVVTDAAISQAVLQKLLSKLSQTSFNAITVDSDTSTSDTVLLAATAAANCAPITSADDPRLEPFEAALNEILSNLALQVVRDGEGATKLVQITVTGAQSDASAKIIALSIANSPLVKTAIAGEDANWGRVVMAIGKAGEPADRDRLQISFGHIRVAHNGQRDPEYSEEEASKIMQNEEIPISVDLGLGEGRARVWTCDLTKEYVAINGDYRS